MSEDPIKVTDLELAILQQIWAFNNSATVNDILENWHQGDAPGYTTVLKTLQKMEAKGIVDHVAAGKKYAYFATIDKEQVTNKRLGTIVDRIFSGSKLSFAQYFIDSGEFNAEELKELKKLIAKKEKKMKND